MSSAEFETDASAWGSPPAARSLVHVLWHRKAFVLLGAFLGLALGFLYHTQRAPVYQSSCQLLVIHKRAAPLQVSGGVDPRLTMVEDYMATHVALLRSPLIVERAVKKRDLGTLKTFENVGDPAGVMTQNLTVARDNKESGSPNNIVVLSYRGPIAEETGKVLSALLDSYQEFLDTTYRDVSAQTLELIGKARDMLKVDLTDSKQKYLAFRQNSPLIWKNKDGVNVEQERVAAIEAKRSQLLLRQTELRDRIRALEKAITEGKAADVLATSQSSGTTPDGKPVAVQKYVEEPILPLILKEQELMEDFGPDHPQVKSIRKRIATMREHLSKLSPQSTEQDPAKRVVIGLRFELEEVEMLLNSTLEVLNKVKVDAKALTNYELQENELRNEVARVELIYETTLKRLQEINLVRDSRPFDARPLSTPGPGGKIGPIAYQDLGLGLILGLLLGAGLAYLAELSDKSFRNPEEIRRRLGLPLVGHIPFIAPDVDAERKRAAGEVSIDPLLCTYFRPKSLESEAYRAVRTALFFATQGLGHKVIQVTSPNKSDGKSLMIANLAIMVAQSGKRVLVIDADLRRPRQHKIFGVDAAAGLGQLLAGDRVATAVVAPTCVPGLSVLPCGPVPHNPSELLTAPRFKEALESFRGEYDYVFVDTPPLLAVTDPCVVASRVDGLFLTIRLTRKGRPDAERARELLAGLNVKILGIVVNGITRGTAGIYSPHAYDYTETYDQDEPEDGDGYYYEQDAADTAPAAAVAPAADRQGGKSFWSRWWPGHS
jgi:capsular exopolysaccharide synthesis family protein